MGKVKSFFDRELDSFFGDCARGWSMIKDAVALFAKEPKLVIPLIFCWLFFAALTIYLRYYFQPPEGYEILSIFLIIFISVLVLTLSCLVVLELLEQLITKRNISLTKATFDAISFDLVKSLPIIFLWSIIWFILLILQALKKKTESSDAESGNVEPSTEDAAKTLSGFNGESFSWSQLGLDMLEKLIRMISFMSLPAIAWENKGPFSGLKTSFQIIKRHPRYFLSAYSMTLLAGIIMALPLVPIFIADDFDIKIPDVIWLFVIIYSGVIWVAQVYLEQIATAQLYLWKIKWQIAGEKGELDSVEKPNFLENSTFKF